MNNIQGNVFATVNSDDAEKDESIIIQIGNNKAVLLNNGNCLKIKLTVKYLYYTLFLRNSLILN